MKIKKRKKLENAKVEGEKVIKIIFTLLTKSEEDFVMKTKKLNLDELQKIEGGRRKYNDGGLCWDAFTAGMVALAHFNFTAAHNAFHEGTLMGCW